MNHKKELLRSLWVGSRITEPVVFYFPGCAVGGPAVLGRWHRDFPWHSWVLGLGLRASELGFRVLGLGLRASELGFRVLGLGLRASELGFRVLGLGLIGLRS